MGQMPWKRQGDRIFWNQREKTQQRLVCKFSIWHFEENSGTQSKSWYWFIFVSWTKILASLSKKEHLLTMQQPSIYSYIQKAGIATMSW